MDKDSVFRVGRLNFEIKRTVGEPDSVKVHIPPGGKLLMEECIESMEMAKEFFGKHYPEFKPVEFNCRSWLLYDGFDEYLGKESNIAKFRGLFDITGNEGAGDAIIFVFSRAASRENIGKFEAKTTLQKKLREHILSGGKLYVGIGRRSCKN